MCPKYNATSIKSSIELGCYINGGKGREYASSAMVRSKNLLNPPLYNAQSDHEFVKGALKEEEKDKMHIKSNENRKEKKYTDRQTERQTGRQTDRQTDRQRDRKTDRQ